MSYKIDDRLICFTLEGIIMANNHCNSVKLNAKYYIDMHHGVMSESVIATEINRRRVFNNEVFRSVNARVMAILMEQDMSNQ